MSIKIPLNLILHFVRKGDEKYLKNHRTFGNFSLIKDLTYKTSDSSFHKLDIIAPVLNHDNGILLFSVHGGGYVYGDKKYNSIFHSYFADKCFTIISANYRLIDNDYDVSIVEQLQDIVDALTYAYDNCHFHKLNFDKLFLVGDSAGGHLVFLLDILFPDEEARRYFNIKNLPPIKIRGVCLNSTMYDMKSLYKYAEKFLSKRGLKKVFSKRCIDEEFMLKTSPSYYVRKNIKLDPLFNSSSYKDQFLSQSLLLKRDMIANQYDFIFDYCRSSDKKYGHIYNHFNFDGEGKRCNEAMINFFMKWANID